MENKEIKNSIVTPFHKKNRYMFGLGTICRDMVYTLVSVYMLNLYFKHVMGFGESGNEFMWASIGAVITIVKVVDAFNDPFMGILVDNTRTKWGKYKPWILFGGIVYGVLTIVMFSTFGGVTGWIFIALFAITHVVQEMAFTTNDIAYWSMLPDLSSDPKEKNIISSIARICANIGAFAVIVAIPLLVNSDHNGILEKALNGNSKLAFLLIVIVLVVLMLLGQLFTLLGVKENKYAHVSKNEKPTTLKDMFRILFKNKQLLIVAISMSLFMAGYMTTTLLGLDYFTLIYEDSSMYSIFTIILGVSQLTGLVIFPFISKKLKRKTVYTVAITSMLVGYLVFFFATKSMIIIGIAGILVFTGQAFIQALMLIFISDCVEYGHFKFKKRNESVSFAVQPFVYKISNAFASLTMTLLFLLPVLRGVNSPANITSSGRIAFKAAMFIVPMILILISAFLFIKFYKIDEKYYQEILLGIDKLEKESN